MENEQEMDTQETTEDLELDLEEDTGEEEEKPVKKEFSDEEKLARIERMRAKLLKKTGRDVETPKPEEKANKSSDLDYGQKAFLKTYGIQGSDELALAKTFMARTGDDLDTIVSDDIFLAKLNSLREARASSDAVPKSTRRSSAPVQDDLNVALAKYRSSGELPQERSLREKVLDAQLHHEKVGNSFSDSPIIQGGSVI